MKNYFGTHGLHLHSSACLSNSAGFVDAVLRNSAVEVFPPNKLDLYLRRQHKAGPRGPTR
jgi:hypothetical protein